MPYWKLHTAARTSSTASLLTINLDGVSLSKSPYKALNKALMGLCVSAMTSKLKFELWVFAVQKC